MYNAVSGAEDRTKLHAFLTALCVNLNRFWQSATSATTVICRPLIGMCPNVFFAWCLLVVKVMKKLSKSALRSIPITRGILPKCSFISNHTKSDMMVQDSWRDEVMVKAKEMSRTYAWGIKLSDRFVQEQMTITTAFSRVMVKVIYGALSRPYICTKKGVKILQHKLTREEGSVGWMPS